ncbi:MAG: hypothetical protein JXA21_25365 [Anaerolineae bacterium]|nr:hypothetical protein [Anaerolineae bacterium]
MIVAATTIQVPQATVRSWFLALKDHPEQYQFDTHAGFEILTGNFGEIGSQFCTREILAGIPVTLHFSLEEVGQDHFRFRVRGNPLKIWGQFTLAAAPDQTTDLSLTVGSDTPWGRAALRFPLTHRAVHRQIQGEINHIQNAIQTHNVKT